MAYSIDKKKYHSYYQEVVRINTAENKQQQVNAYLLLCAKLQM